MFFMARWAEDTYQG